MNDPELIEAGIVAALTAAREQQGLTYEQVASRAGIHRTTPSLIERDKRGMTLNVFLKLCAALGLEPSELLASATTNRPNLSARMPEAARTAPTLHETPRTLDDDKKE